MSENKKDILARNQCLLKIFRLTGESITIPLIIFIFNNLHAGIIYMEVMLSQQ